VTLEKGIKCAYEVGKKFSVRHCYTANCIWESFSNPFETWQGSKTRGSYSCLFSLPLEIIFFIKDVVDLTDGNISEAADKVIN
jgi:hypothetical protein